MNNLERLIHYTDKTIKDNILIDDYSVLEWFRIFKLSTLEALYFYDYLGERSIRVLNTGNNLKSIHDYISFLIENEIISIRFSDVIARLGSYRKLININEIENYIISKNIEIIGSFDNISETNIIVPDSNKNIVDHNTSNFKVKNEVMSVPIDKIKIGTEEYVIINSNLDNKLHDNEINTENVTIKSNNNFEDNIENSVAENDTKINQNNNAFNDGKEETKVTTFIDMDYTLPLEDLLKSDNFKNSLKQMKNEISWKNNKEALFELSEIKDISDNQYKDIVEELVQANTRLIMKCVIKYKRFATASYNEDDMYQEGRIGLLKAISKFDLNMDTELSTYATWWIRQSITRGICDQSSTIRIPVHMVERIQKFNQFERDYINTYNRIPSDLVIAEFLEISVDKVDELYVYRQYSKLTSLDLPIGIEEDTSLGEFIQDEKAISPEQYIIEKGTRNELLTIIDSNLKPKEAEILKLRFGLYDGTRYTLESIGRKYGLTRERIRQIEKRALDRMKNLLRREDYDFIR